MLIPHQFKNGEPATARDYDLTITYQPHPNFVQEEPPEELVIQAPYEASAKHSEPSLREGNHVTLDQATRSFKEVIDPGGGGGGGTGGFSQMQAYMSDPEYGTTQTITVEVLTPGMFMVLHGPSTHGDTGSGIERPDDDITPYSGLLPKNIDNDREAEPDSPTAVLWDWNRDDLDPSAPENAGDDDFVAIELNFDPSHSATVPGLAGQVELRLPQHTRAFTADGTELTSADLVVDINNPSGPFSELISQGVQLVWIEGSAEFVHSFVEFVYEIIGNAAGMTGPIGDMADLHTLDLDVSGNQQVNQPEDGLTSYLPGYRGDDALLHDDSKSFADLTYTGAQTLHLVIEGAAHLQAEFEIINVSSHPGFAVNTPHDAFGEGAEEDFSFDPDINERLATGVPAGDHLVVPIYCKDYGGYCLVRVILRDNNDKEIGRTHQWLPNWTRQYVIADVWLIAEAERWQALHVGIPIPGGDFKPGDDTEPLEPHETEGDGLTVFEEYRGFMLDGGRDENGPHDGGHRRLSPARKECLVHVSMIPGLPADGQPENFMPGIAELYNHPTDGVLVDIHWIVTEQDYPDDGPVKYHELGHLDDRTLAYQYVDEGLTYFISYDNALKKTNEEDEQQIMNYFEGLEPYNRAAAGRRPGHVAQWFRFVMLLGRRGEIDNFGGLLKPTTGKAFYTTGNQMKDRMAVLFVEGIADEAGTLAANMHYAAAHELFHGLIEKRGAAPDWDQHEHLIGSDSVMGSLPPPPSDPGARLAIKFDEAGKEKSAVDLKARQGLHPVP